MNHLRCEPAARHPNAAPNASPRPTSRNVDTRWCRSSTATNPSTNPPARKLALPAVIRPCGVLTGHAHTERVDFERPNHGSGRRGTMSRRVLAGRRSGGSIGGRGRACRGDGHRARALLRDRRVHRERLRVHAPPRADVLRPWASPRRHDRPGLSGQGRLSLPRSRHESRHRPVVRGPRPRGCSTKSRPPRSRGLLRVRPWRPASRLLSKTLRAT